jgi:hypothetical protein
MCVLFALQARQLCELLDFAEQERLTLLEKEAALQHELEQVRLPRSHSRTCTFYSFATSLLALLSPPAALHSIETESLCTRGCATA